MLLQSASGRNTYAVRGPALFFAVDFEHETFLPLDGFAVPLTPRESILDAPGLSLQKATLFEWRRSLAERHFYHSIGGLHTIATINGNSGISCSSNTRPSHIFACGATLID